MLIRSPHEKFFSSAITVPNASIHRKWTLTAANINSINDQQQPMQNKP